MTQIQLTFEDYEEMISFAKKLINAEKGTIKLAAGEKSEGGQTEEEKVDTTPYGRQIAQDFPNANTGIPAAAPDAPAMMPTEPPTPAAPPVPPIPQTPAVPTSEPTYTAEELQVAAVTLVDKGMMTQLQELLQQFGVNALPELPKEKYGAFATALRGMGAQI